MIQALAILEPQNFPSSELRGWWDPFVLSSLCSGISHIRVHSLSGLSMASGPAWPGLVWSQSILQHKQKFSRKLSKNRTSFSGTYTTTRPDSPKPSSERKKKKKENRIHYFFPFASSAALILSRCARLPPNFGPEEVVAVAALAFVAGCLRERFRCSACARNSALNAAAAAASGSRSDVLLVWGCLEVVGAV